MRPIMLLVPMRMGGPQVPTPEEMNMWVPSSQYRPLKRLQIALAMRLKG